MKLRLSKTQVYELMPYFDRVRAAATLGKPGMLVAQLFYDATNEQYTMEPCFIDHELAQPLIEKARREIPGRLERRPRLPGYGSRVRAS